MAVTYSQADVALTEIASGINQNSNGLVSAKQQISSAVSNLAAMPTRYAEVLAAIDAAAAAMPTDTAYKNMKARKDKLVADFTALKATAQAMLDALTGI